MADPNLTQLKANVRAGANTQPEPVVRVTRVDLAENVRSGISESYERGKQASRRGVTTARIPRWARHANWMFLGVAWGRYMETFDTQYLWSAAVIVGVLLLLQGKP